jgi:hypothetical protein
LAVEDTRGGSALPETESLPHSYIDQDTTDEFMDRPAPTYASGHTPEEQRARVDKILADVKAGKRTLPPRPRIGEG